MENKDTGHIPSQTAEGVGEQHGKRRQGPTSEKPSEPSLITPAELLLWPVRSGQHQEGPSGSSVMPFQTACLPLDSGFHVPWNQTPHPFHAFPPKGAIHPKQARSSASSQNLTLTCSLIHTQSNRLKRTSTTCQPTSDGTNIT